MACELFGFSREELIGVQLSDLVTLKSKGPTTINETHLEDSGDIVQVSGKVVSNKLYQLYYIPLNLQHPCIIKIIK